MRTLIQSLNCYFSPSHISSNNLAEINTGILLHHDIVCPNIRVKTDVPQGSSTIRIELMSFTCCCYVEFQKAQATKLFCYGDAFGQGIHHFDTHWYLSTDLPSALP